MPFIDVPGLPPDAKEKEDDDYDGTDDGYSE
jgi:hypothetical protein